MKLGFHLVMFFFYLYSMIVALIKGRGVVALGVASVLSCKSDKIMVLVARGGITERYHDFV